jgi:hypothetical protein
MSDIPGRRPGSHTWTTRQAQPGHCVRQRKHGRQHHRCRKAAAELRWKIDGTIGGKDRDQCRDTKRAAEKAPC